MLSEDVQSYIEVLDAEREKDLAHDFGGKTAQLLRLLDRVVSYFVESRETILPDLPLDFETLLGEPTVEGLLDDRFTREAVDSVSGYVNRTLRLSRMKALQTPSRVTNTYLREAARTYVLGLPQACVALCRAALEQSLKESLGIQSSRTYVEFRNLVDEAVGGGVLDDKTARMARDLAKAGDDVLHEKPTTLAQAEDVLINVRGLVQEIYSL